MYRWLLFSLSFLCTAAHAETSKQERCFQRFRECGSSSDVTECITALYHCKEFTTPKIRTMLDAGANRRPMGRICHPDDRHLDCADATPTISQEEYYEQVIRGNKAPPPTVTATPPPASVPQLPTVTSTPQKITLEISRDTIPLIIGIALATFLVFFRRLWLPVSFKIPEIPKTDAPTLLIRIGEWWQRKRSEAAAKASAALAIKQIQNRVDAERALITALTYLDNLDLSHDLFSAEMWHPIMAATKHVVKAREKYPDISVEFTNKKKETEVFSVDRVAERLLWTEAVLKSDHHLIPIMWEEGLAAIDKAINYSPKNVTYHCRKALLHTRLKQRRKAEQSISNALAIDPSSFEALQMRDRLSADPMIGVNPWWKPGAGTYMLIAAGLVIGGAYMTYVAQGGPYPLMVFAGLFLWWRAVKKDNREIIEHVERQDRKRSGAKGPHDL